ncbi:MAG: hypothetical protein AAB316_05510 [Bacteroidota bacterium]
MRFPGLSYSPPKVNYKRPNLKTFLAFLNSKGWRLIEKKSGYCLMEAPEEIKREDGQPFRYYLPCAEESRSHDELAHHAVETFSDLYDIPLQELFDLLSQSIPDLQLEVERQPKQWKMKKEIVENAVSS